MEQPQDKKRVQKPNIIEAVQEKYSAAGWSVVLGGGSVHLIARRGNRLHFVQVVPVDKVDEPAWTGEARNSFVQNALSNDAEPIHAVVKVHKARAGGFTYKITMTNVNLSTTVIIARSKAAKGGAAAADTAATI